MTSHPSPQGQPNVGPTTAAPPPRYHRGMVRIAVAFACIAVFLVAGIFVLSIYGDSLGPKGDTGTGFPVSAHPSVGIRKSAGYVCAPQLNIVSIPLAPSSRDLTDSSYDYHGTLIHLLQSNEAGEQSAVQVSVGEFYDTKKLPTQSVIVTTKAGTQGELKVTSDMRKNGFILHTADYSGGYISGITLCLSSAAKAG